MSEKREYRIRVRMTNAAENSAHTMVKQGRGKILSDVLGSYTGTARDSAEPEQDADDL